MGGLGADNKEEQEVRLMPCYSYAKTASKVKLTVQNASGVIKPRGVAFGSCRRNCPPLPSRSVEPRKVAQQQH